LSRNIVVTNRIELSRNIVVTNRIELSPTTDELVQKTVMDV